MSWNDLLAKTLESPKARAAFNETELRIRLAEVFSGEMKRKGYSVRAFAKKIGTSISQVQRLLHHDIGGSLTLLSIVKAANALELDLDICLRP